jgi:predicted NBD/HSP70 family sugar kinase
LFSLIKQRNIASVLQVLHLEQKASRARIAAATGTARSTVSNIIEKLEQMELVEYTDEHADPGAVGRPGALLRLNPKSFYALGIDINVFTSRAMLVGLNGIVLEKQQIDFEDQTGPDQVLPGLTEAAEQVIARSGIDRGRIIGLGVSFMGLADPIRGRVIRSTSLPEWNRTNIAGVFRKNFPFPVFVENNANAMVLGEARFGIGRGKENLVGVIVDEGIGGGIVINRRLYTGSYAAAGEFGHISIAQAGPICHCGNRGCLRTLASESAVEANAIRMIKAGVQTLLRSKEDLDHLRITVHDVIEAAKREDTVSKDIIAEAARYMGMGLVNLVNVLSPEMVIFNEGPLSTFEHYYEVVRKTIATGSYAGERGVPDLVISALGENAVCIGAASVVMDRILAGR